jgi:hypothetical protein
MLGSPPQVIPDRNPLLETAFRSPPTASRCRAPIEGLTFLTCFFTAPLNFALNPCDLQLPRLDPVCPDRGVFYAANPLPSSQLSGFVR